MMALIIFKFFAFTYILECLLKPITKFTKDLSPADRGMVFWVSIYYSICDRI